MKTSFLSISAALCLATAAPAATVLVNETWSGYNNGPAETQFTDNGGIWKRETGATAGATIANYSASGSGKGLQVIPASGSWIRFNTVDSYAAPDGVRYDLQMMRLEDLQSFTRMRIQTTEDLNGTTGYYLSIASSGLPLTHLTGSGSTQIGSYTFTTGAFTFGTTYEFGLEVLTGATGNTVNVYFDNARVINVSDSAAVRPDFINNELYFAFDNRRPGPDAAKAIYGDITITAVPEASTTALALVSLFGLGGWRWAARRRVA